MTAPWILIVEDEPLLGELLADNLRHAGFAPELVTDGIEAWDRLQRGGIDLLLLDLMLPSLSGFDVLRRLRELGSRLPVLILSARSSDEERIRGLSLGADDFVAKPFNIRELVLRVRALLRRAQERPDPEETPLVLEIAGHTVDLASFEVRRQDGAVERLTAREAHLLRYLVGHAGRVVSRNDILDAVWGRDAYPTPRTIDNFIARFRKLFESDARQPRHFLTLRGVGYRFEP